MGYMRTTYLVLLVAAVAAIVVGITVTVILLLKKKKKKPAITTAAATTSTTPPITTGTTTTGATTTGATTTGATTTGATTTKTRKPRPRRTTPAPVTTTLPPAVTTISPTSAVPSRVVITAAGMYVDGAPFRIKGVAGSYSHESLAALREWGGNTVRVYNANNLQANLDAAHMHGLFVIVGLSSSSTRDLAAESRRVQAVVDRYKGHPAVLCWNIGNEMDVVDDLLQRVDALARAIKSVDPGHPVINSFVDFGSKATSSGPNASALLVALRRGTALDAVGINTYGSAPSLAQRYESWLLPVPFVVTELGWWPGLQGRRAPWVQADTPEARVVTYEKTSTERAEHVGAALTAMYASAQCLGGTAFRWGPISGTGVQVNIWHMLYHAFPGGPISRTSVGDELIRAWTGRLPSVVAPKITSKGVYEWWSNAGGRVRIETTWGGITMAPTNDLQAGQRVDAQVTLDRAGVPCTWEIRQHYDRRNKATAVLWSETTGASTPSQVTFAAPPPGTYRLYVFGSDRGSVVSASMPFRTV